MYICISFDKYLANLLTFTQFIYSIFIYFIYTSQEYICHPLYTSLAPKSLPWSYNQWMTNVTKTPECVLESLSHYSLLYSIYTYMYNNWSTHTLHVHTGWFQLQLMRMSRHIRQMLPFKWTIWIETGEESCLCNHLACQIRCSHVIE